MYVIIPHSQCFREKIYTFLKLLGSVYNIQELKHLFSSSVSFYKRKTYILFIHLFLITSLLVRIVLIYVVQKLCSCTCAHNSTHLWGLQTLNTLQKITSINPLLISMAKSCVQKVFLPNSTRCLTPFSLCRIHGGNRGQSETSDLGYFHFPSHFTSLQ